MVTTHFSDDVEIPSRFDLQLNTLITETEIAFDSFEQARYCRLNSKTHTDRHSFQFSANQRRKRLFARLGQQVHVGEFESGLGHVVSTKPRQTMSQIIQATDRRIDDRRRKKVSNYVQGSAGSLVTVKRFLGSNDFTPACQSIRLETNEEDETRINLAEARYERLDKGQTDQTNLYTVDFDRGRSVRLLLENSGLHGARENSTLILFVQQMLYKN